jgi:hypothetical protein
LFVRSQKVVNLVIVGRNSVLTKNNLIMHVVVESWTSKVVKFGLNHARIVVLLPELLRCPDHLKNDIF